MASFDEQPNGGALSVEATLGETVFEPVHRLEPTDQTINEDADQPIPDNTPNNEITRAYLVELRVGWQIHRKTSDEQPYLYCIYATGDCRRFFERRLHIDYGKNGFQIPDDTVLYSSVTTTKTGNRTLPSTPPDESPEEMHSHYRHLLETLDSIDVDAYRDTTPDEGGQPREVRA
ncbi:hypothetical protein [Halomicrococcus sp. SG-WS-1]|uniref:hypothetical protein n=1 Tax=Halomicrococcus sp. SG-WS-1 TaxID=3439057 RepID=UPI003F79F56F